jgi:acyl-CoA reductase-like NAD-dependent aldehyde dehydrogenase
MLIHNPATDEVAGEVAEDTAQVIADKVVRARRAQRAWSARSYLERRGAIERFRGIAMERAARWAQTTTTEMGKPIIQARRELEGLLGRLDFFLAHTEAELRPEVVHHQAGLEEIISHEPLGVVANVSAWNYPYFVGSNVFIPALLTGNAVVYKPSEYATLTGLEIASGLHDAGVPPDVFVVVSGGGQAGATLLEQPLDGVFFTGSHATGVRIAQAVAPRLVRLQLELGGKDPVYVTDDVDVDAAAPAVADGAFYNTGQSCCAVERIYVHERVFERFVERFVAEVESYRVGDPLDEATYIGPLARRKAQLDVLEEQVRDALGKGARLLTGGRRAQRPGWFYEPTVLIDVSHDMLVMTEESFGPIIGILKVAGDAEALERMGDTRYGLTASVYSRDRDRAEALLRELDVGTAYWNCSDRVSPRLPWSGRRCSGVGCTLSSYGIEAFLRPKAWHLRRP